MESDPYTGLQPDLADDPEGVVPSQWGPLPEVPEEQRGSQRLCVALLGDAVQAAWNRSRRRELAEWIEDPWDRRYRIPFGYAVQCIGWDLDWITKGLRMMIARLDALEARPVEPRPPTVRYRGVQRLQHQAVAA